MKTREIEIAEKMTLKELIDKEYKDCSNSRKKSILTRGVIINSRRVTQYNYVLEPGVKVTIEGDEQRGKPGRGKMPIVYEDRYLMVVDKPVGLLSSSAHERDITVITELNGYFLKRRTKQRAHVVHRLDRETSGLLMVAKSKEVSRKLEMEWQERILDREYVGVTWGVPQPAQGTLVSWLTDGEYCVLSSPVDNGGKKAITHYKTLKKRNRYALVEFSLETGRRNQIRVQMKANGHPILKDEIYGYEKDNSPIKRMALHARRLHFIHPVTEKEINLITEIPKEFLQLFE